MSRLTSAKGTRFERISSAISKSWFMKNMKKKNARATKKERRYSRQIYLYSVLYRVIIQDPVDPNPPVPRVVSVIDSIYLNSPRMTGENNNWAILSPG